MSIMSNNKKIVISLGGSIMVPQEPNISFLSDFVSLIKNYVEQGYSFCIITGGGKTARVYQDALREVANLSAQMIDWMGIYSTRLNAQLLRMLFEDYAHDAVVWHPFPFEEINSPVVVGAGHEPGNSSDMGAVIAAKDLGASRVINLSNIDYVYESDPRKDPNAKKFEELDWSSYLDIIPKEWTPGMSSPFDPVASRFAQENDIEVAIINGDNLSSLQKYIEGKDFEGTRMYG